MSKWIMAVVLSSLVVAAPVFAKSKRAGKVRKNAHALSAPRVNSGSRFVVTQLDRVGCAASKSKVQGTLHYLGAYNSVVKSGFSFRRNARQGKSICEALQSARRSRAVLSMTVQGYGSPDAMISEIVIGRRAYSFQ